MNIFYVRHYMFKYEYIDPLVGQKDYDRKCINLLENSIKAGTISLSLSSYLFMPAAFSFLDNILHGTAIGLKFYHFS